MPSEDVENICVVKVRSASQVLFTNQEQSGQGIMPEAYNQER